MPSASPASSVGAILNHAYSMMGSSLASKSLQTFGIRSFFKEKWLLPHVWRDP